MILKSLDIIRRIYGDIVNIVKGGRKFFIETMEVCNYLLGIINSLFSTSIQIGRAHV